MNYKSNILLAFSLLLSICVAGQNLPDSVIITSITYVNDYNGGETLYDMKPFSLVYKQASYHSNDKIINKKKIISFLNELSNDSKNDNSLGKYGIDTTWVKNNPSELLKLYADKNRVEWNEQQKQFIYKQLTDISYYEKELRRYLDAGCCYTLHQNYRTDYRVSIYKNGELRNHITSRRRVGATSSLGRTWQEIHSMVTKLNPP